MADKDDKYILAKHAEIYPNEADVCTLIFADLLLKLERSEP